MSTTMQIVLVVVLILTVIGCFFLMNALIEWALFLLVRKSLRTGARLAVQAAWAKVHRHEHGTLKVVEADKILDEALRLLGYKGTLGEKLKQAGARFKDLDAVWKAHKLRNTLVHKLDALPRDKEVEQAVESFRHALNDLGAKIERSR